MATQTVVSDPGVARAVSAENVAVGPEIVRHRLSSRFIHWLVALTFVVTLLTGMPIWSPVFTWMGAIFGGLHVCRWLHPWAGAAFAFMSVIMFFHWISDMVLEKGEFAWIGPKLIEYFRFQEHDDDVGKYNGGQKIYFFIVTILMVLLLGTGIVLWFPLSFAAPLRQLSIIVHDASFILFAASIVVHIYLGTAAEPGTFQAMTRGTVSKPWARLHHPRWYREVTGEDRGDRHE